MLLEVDLPKDDVQFEIAVSLLKKARDELDAGNYDGVVQKCRLALESVNKILKLDDATKTAVVEFVGNRRQMSKRSRTLMVGEAARHFSHPALHVDDEGGTFDYGRRDASFMLALTCALVSNASGGLR